MGSSTYILGTAAVEPVLWLCESCSSLFASKAAAIGVPMDDLVES